MTQTMLQNIREPSKDTAPIATKRAPYICQVSTKDSFRGITIVKPTKPIKMAMRRMPEIRTVQYHENRAVHPTALVPRRADSGGAHSARSRLRRLSGVLRCPLCPIPSCPVAAQPTYADSPQAPGSHCRQSPAEAQLRRFSCAWSNRSRRKCRTRNNNFASA